MGNCAHDLTDSFVPIKRSALAPLEIIRDREVVWEHEPARQHREQVSREIPNTYLLVVGKKGVCAHSGNGGVGLLMFNSLITSSVRSTFLETKNG